MPFKSAAPSPPVSVINSKKATAPETKTRNPPWSREELILALTLYVKHRHALPGPTSSEVIALSELLGDVGRTLGMAQSKSFRNANGVAMKLQNFKRFDPLYSVNGKVGLQKGDKDEEEVWHEFVHDIDELNTLASAIVSTVKMHVADGELAKSPDGELTEAAEGQLLTRLHRYRERSRLLVERRKKQALQEQGKLVCEACGFNFSDRYGESGAGLIEVHHTTPVHTLRAGETTKLAELALLCANCHRVVHARKKWLTVQELIEVIKTSSLA